MKPKSNPIEIKECADLAGHWLTSALSVQVGQKCAWFRRQPLIKALVKLVLVAVSLALGSDASGAVVGTAPLRINGGKADFGSGSHFLGGPTGDASVTWELTPENGVLRAKATVKGTLYYDSLSGPGTAKVLVEFFRSTSPTSNEYVDSVLFSVSGRGGDANLATNQLAINIGRSDRDLDAVQIKTYEVRSDGSLAETGFRNSSIADTWDFNPKVNNGSADFGTGNHEFGAPRYGGFVYLIRRKPDNDPDPFTPLGNMLGVVKGVLYFDSLFGGGTARIIIDFQDASGNALATRTRDVSGPGGDANKSSNRRLIDEDFISPSLFQIRLRVGPISNGSLVNPVTRTIRVQGATAGTLELTPSTPEVAVHERLNYAFSWTVPEPLNWHDLESLRLRIRGTEGVIFSLLFDEASNTFALVNEDNGHIGPAFPGGSNARLETSHASLTLADSSVVGSGPTGPSVTLNLALDFKPQASGQTFVVEVAGSDDDGNEDPFTAAGSLTVTE